MQRLASYDPPYVALRITVLKASGLRRPVTSPMKCRVSVIGDAFGTCLVKQRTT